MIEIDYSIRYLDLPSSIKGYTLKQEDYYTIVLNSKLNKEQNINTLRHEIAHIESEDFSRMFPASLVERRAHGYSEEVTIR